MVQDLTLKELKWRYRTLTNKIESDSAEITQKYEFNENFGINDYVVWELIHASILYLCKTKNVNAVLYSCDEGTPGLFTCSKEEFLNHRCDYHIHSYDEIDKEIPIPNIFERDGEQYEYLTIDFIYPKNELGELCERMINELRRRCKDDVDVINIVTFIVIYLNSNSQLYYSCFWTFAFLSLIEHSTLGGSHYPLEIIDLFASLIGENIGDVYDPFGRTCLNSDIASDKYYAQVNSLEHLYMGRLANAIYEKDWEHIVLEDCKNEWNCHGCDTIVATPAIDDTYTEPDGTCYHISKWILEKIKNSIIKGECNQAITLLPANILFDKSYKDIRKDFVSAGFLDTIVLLPDNLFENTGISATLVIFKKNRKNEDIRMINLSSIVISKDRYPWEEKNELNTEKALDIIKTNTQELVTFTDTESIIKHDYSWFVPAFLLPNIDVPDGYIKVKISDIMQEIKMFECNPNISNIIIDENVLINDPFVTNVIRANKDIKDVPGDYDDYYFIWNDVFIASFYYEVKSAWFDSGTDLYNNNGVCIKDSCGTPYYVNKDVIDINYLRYLLTLVQTDLEKQNLFPIINEAACNSAENLFLDYEVVIPLSIDEQRQIYNDEKNKHLVKIAREEGLQEAKKQIKEEYVEELRMRRHDMKPFLSQIDSLAKLIPFYLKKIEGNEEAVLAIQDKVESLSESVYELRKRLNRLTDEEIFGVPELLDIVTSTKQYEGVYSNYTVKVNIDEMAIRELNAKSYVYINPVDLSTLYNTIIDNAVTHAFIDKNKKYSILINLRVSNDKRCFIIDFTNNGEPMPEGMDKRRYGINGEKGAKSNGTGYGGYRVKSITRHYYGDYDIIIRQKDGTDTYNQVHRNWTAQIASSSDEIMKSILSEQLAIRKKYEVIYPTNEYCTTIRLYLIRPQINEKV